MGSSTFYDIILRYTLQDRVSGKTAKLQKSTEKAAKSAFGLEKAMLAASAAAAGFFGARAAGKALIGFNADLDQAKIQMAGLMQLNLGGAWSKNMAEANSLVADFQQIAKSSVGTTKDFVDMASLIVRPVTAAGASMQDLRDITKGGVVAAQAFGIASDVAGRDIEEALMGNLTKVSKFARALLEPQGWTTETFNALDANKRRDELIKAMKGRAIQDMARAQGESWGGITSTLVDNLQMGLGKVGLPLMKAITAEVQKWNAWIEQNPHKIAAITDKVGKALADGFGAVKAAVEWIATNKDTLLSLAKAALLLRGGSMVGNLIGSPLKGLAEAADNWGKASKATGTFAEKVSGAAAKISAVTTALGAVAAGASLIADHVLKQREKDVAKQRTIETDFDYAMRVGREQVRDPSAKAAVSRVEDALASGLLKRRAGGGFEVDQKALATGAGRGDEFMVMQMQGIGHLYERSTNELRAEMGLLRMAAIAWRGSLEIAINKGWMALGAAAAGRTQNATDELIASTKGAKLAAKPKVTININRIEVQSDDPDRLAFGLIESFRDAAKNPSSAVDALREG